MSAEFFLGFVGRLQIHQNALAPHRDPAALLPDTGKMEPIVLRRCSRTLGDAARAPSPSPSETRPISGSMGLIITSENDIKGQRHGGRGCARLPRQRERQSIWREGGREGKGRSLERKRAKCHLTPPHVLPLLLHRASERASDSVSLSG